VKAWAKLDEQIADAAAAADAAERAVVRARVRYQTLVARRTETKMQALG
jgi:hypothetical protein